MPQKPLIKNMTALELAAQIRAKKISVQEAVRQCFTTVKASKTNAFITLCEERALLRAEEVQRLIDGGARLSPLAGVPIGVKDNISTAGVLTTCASKMLGNYVPFFNATVIDKIEQAGLIIIGKLNMDEFAMGGSGETSCIGAVKNPHDLTRVAGGSSSGSAAAVAAGEVPLALGTDTGGSIRQPAMFCGVVGIKPTYGSVSRYGAVAFASSLDQIGTVGKTVEDAAALLDIISGPDPKDQTCIAAPQLQTHGKRLKIGLPKNYLQKGIDEDVKGAVLEAAGRFKAAGAVVEEYEMPLTEYAVPAYYIIACAEASSNLARFDGLKYGHASKGAKSLQELYRLSRTEGFGLEVKRRIMMGSFVLSSGFYDAYYKKALKVRGLVKRAFTEQFAKYDAILSPVAPTAAYKLGENFNDPLKMMMADIYTVSVNLAGLPAIAVPAGKNKHGLPLGFQLIGPAFSDNKLMQIAKTLEVEL